MQKINQLYEKHCGLKKVLKRETSNHFNPWLTKGILKSIKIKSNLQTILHMFKSRQKTGTLS